MKVKIIRSEAWHTGMIGKVFNVTEPDAVGTVYVDAPGNPHHGNGLYMRDYAVVKGFDKDMKIRVKDKAHSEAIQRAVFAAGGKWGGDDHGYAQYTDRKFLYIYSDGNLYHGSDEDHFNDSKNVEVELVTGNFVEAKATKIVSHEGKKYEVPGWATFLSRDNDGAAVFAWEVKPEWASTASGYNTTKGRRTLVVEYVPPKPAGSFCVAV